MSTRLFTGDPSATCRQRTRQVAISRGWSNLAVQRHGRLQRDEWSLVTNVFCECLVQLPGLSFAKALVDLNAGGAQFREPAARDERIRIVHGGEHLFHAGSDDRISAGRCASHMNTGLETDVESA